MTSDSHIDGTNPLLSDAAVDGAVTERLARRPWPTTPIQRRTRVSFEFFPTNTDAGTRSLLKCARQLGAVEPDFFSVTYGAGGSTRDRTHAAINTVQQATQSPVAGHITCVAASRSTVHDTLDRYRANGVTRLVALRGDSPDGYVEGSVTNGYSDAADLVAGIRNRPDGEEFDISVAAYPEIHPKATSAAADMDNLKRKLEAGADRAITQFFFDTDAFLRFHQAALDAGIQAPIVPGIMPVTNFERVAGFAKRCGTTIPAWMPDLFADLDETPEAQNLTAATVAAEQCRRLAEHGIQQFHFYTMNRPELSLAVCRTLGLTAAGDAKSEGTTGVIEVAS